MPEEQWLPVVGYEGRYEVSDHGRVRKTNGHIMKQRVRRGLYPVLSLYGGTPYTRTFPIHQLVAIAFLGPRPEGMETNHKDGDKLNNRVENLEWVTKKDNCLHRFHVLGKRNLPILRGSDQPTSKLTDDEVLEIRRLADQGRLPQTEIAKRFGIDQAMVSLIKSRKRWAHL